MARHVDSYAIIDEIPTMWPLFLAIISGKNTRIVCGQIYSLSLNPALWEQYMESHPNVSNKIHIHDSFEIFCFTL